MQDGRAHRFYEKTAVIMNAMLKNEQYWQPNLIENA